MVSAERGYQCSDSADFVLPSAKQTVLRRITGVNVCSFGDKWHNHQSGAPPSTRCCRNSSEGWHKAERQENRACIPAFSRSIQLRPASERLFFAPPPAILLDMVPGWHLYVLHHRLSYSGTRTSPWEPETGGHSHGKGHSQISEHQAGHKRHTEGVWVPELGVCRDTLVKHTLGVVRDNKAQQHSAGGTNNPAGGTNNPCRGNK